MKMNTSKLCWTSGVLFFTVFLVMVRMASWNAACGFMTFGVLSLYFICGGVWALHEGRRLQAERCEGAGRFILAAICFGYPAVMLLFAALAWLAK